MKNTEVISISCMVNASLEKVWAYWNDSKHIMQWNTASEDWHTPNSINNFVVDGKFSHTMSAKDGSMSFDFCGIYNQIIPLEKIIYTLEDDRKVEIYFESIDNQIKIIEIFEAEKENSIQMQQQGWQAILNNFKKYTENN